MASARMVFGRFGLSGAWLCLAVLTGAEERPQLPSESGLTEIKRDYEALRSARTPSGQPPIAVPIGRVIDLKTGVATPDILLNPSGRLAPGRKSARELAKEREKSRNWLLDGVTEQEKAIARALNGDRSNEPAETVTVQDPLTGALLNREPDGSDPAAALAVFSEPPRKERTEPLADAANPLAPFMSLWMRSGDYELLATGQSPASDEIVASITLPAGDSLPSVAPNSGACSLAMSGASPGAVANPYLQNVQADPAALGTASQSALIAPAFVPAVSGENSGGVLVPPPSPSPTLSEKLRARDDARYFKQLKRF